MANGVRHLHGDGIRCRNAIGVIILIISGMACCRIGHRRVPKLLIFGNIISGTHSWMGTSRFPKPAMVPGMMKKKIINMAWIVWAAGGGSGHPHHGESSPG